MSDDDRWEEKKRKSWLESIKMRNASVTEVASVKEGATKSEARPLHLPTYQCISLERCTVLFNGKQHPLRVVIMLALCGTSHSKERTMPFYNINPVCVVVGDG
jgi:hypothetical protein